MAIVVDLDIELARSRMTLGELAERVGITPVNLSVLKNNRAKAVRFTTLDAICRELAASPPTSSGTSRKVRKPLARGEAVRTASANGTACRGWRGSWVRVRALRVQ